MLVADMTDPDWEPVMKRASAIVTTGRADFCHAAIIARELGIRRWLAVAMQQTPLSNGDQVTVSCAEGDTGKIYEGKLAFERTEVALDKMPDAPTKIMLNVANPDPPSSSRRSPIMALGWRVWNSSSIARSVSIRVRCWSSIRCRPT